MRHTRRRGIARGKTQVDHTRAIGRFGADERDGVRGTRGDPMKEPDREVRCMHHAFAELDVTRACVRAGQHGLERGRATLAPRSDQRRGRGRDRGFGLGRRTGSDRGRRAPIGRRLVAADQPDHGRGGHKPARPR